MTGRLRYMVLFGPPTGSPPSAVTAGRRALYRPLSSKGVVYTGSEGGSVGAEKNEGISVRSVAFKLLPGMSEQPRNIRRMLYCSLRSMHRSYQGDFIVGVCVIISTNTRD